MSTEAQEQAPIPLPEADCLLIVPPLAHLTWPSLGVHQLQAVAREAGFEVAILYVNQLYAQRIGAVRYASLCNAPVHWLLGERLFARAAYGAPALGFRTEDFLAEVDERDVDGLGWPTAYTDHLTGSSGDALPGTESRYSRAFLAECEAQAFALTAQVGAAIAAAPYPLVGATTTFDQTSAAVALLDRIKTLRPTVTTLLGGANCDGEMARGIRSLGGGIDTVFSGESERVFVDFLAAHREKNPPREPVIHGAPCVDLDGLPTPDFADYFDQLDPGLRDTPLWLLMETSRGCWWGAKHHCSFCGLNATGMFFREKSPDRVVGQLQQVLRRAPTHRVCMTDNIMPHTYHRTLIGRLADEVPGVRLFYEQKANLDLAQITALMKAGCASIQPGIEALDTSLLQRMNKGVRARQNIALLRYTRSVAMMVKWNLLWGFPGDDAASYHRVLALLPLLRHLVPPQALAPIHLDRFSPYFDSPADHGITDLKPLPAYTDVFPCHADHPRLAYHFDGDWVSGAYADPTVIQDLSDEVERWRTAWGGDYRSSPYLHVLCPQPGTFLLRDTRGLGGPTSLFLDPAQTHALLVGGPVDRVPAAAWALRNGYAVALDDWCVPLATADASLLATLEARYRAQDVAPTTPKRLS